MLHVATCLWEPNRHSLPFSRCYDETWVEKLYQGFARNLTAPFRFELFTDRKRELPSHIGQRPIGDISEPDYGSFIAPYRLGEPMILVGLDTIITGNIDHLAEYCFTASSPAYPRDPYNPARVCNGVALVPRGHAYIYVGHRGENDMEWIRRFIHADSDVLFPGQIVSYKGYVRDRGLGDARIVYFHGAQKPHELPDIPWIAEHWRE